MSGTFVEKVGRVVLSRPAEYWQKVKLAVLLWYLAALVWFLVLHAR